MQRLDRSGFQWGIRRCLWLLAALACMAGLGQAARYNAAAQGAPFDLATALAAAEAGAVITVPPGSYAGPFRIEKPVTLVGEGMHCLGRLLRQDRRQRRKEKRESEYEAREQRHGGHPEGLSRNDPSALSRRQMFR